jgi:hypothetical protein
MKKIYIAGATVGVLMIALGFVTDIIGLGPVPGMGMKQIALVVVGALVLGVSLYLGKKQQ